MRNANLSAARRLLLPLQILFCKCRQSVPYSAPRCPTHFNNWARFSFQLSFKNATHKLNYPKKKKMKKFNKIFDGDANIVYTYPRRCVWLLALKVTLIKKFCILIRQAHFCCQPVCTCMCVCVRCEQWFLLYGHMDMFVLRHIN